MSQQNYYQTPNSDVDTSGAQQNAEWHVWTAQGRMGRLRFFNHAVVIPMIAAFLLYFLIGIAAAIVIPVKGGSPEAILGGVFGITIGLVLFALGILYLVYSFFVIIQRCHDINITGWLSLVWIVGGFLFTLILCFVPGTQGPNDYGPPPKPNSTGHTVLAVVGPVVVVVILGILAAIAIPAYQGYIDAAERARQMEQRQ